MTAPVAPADAETIDDRLDPNGDASLLSECWHRDLEVREVGRADRAGEPQREALARLAARPARQQRPQIGRVQLGLVGSDRDEL